MPSQYKQCPFCPAQIDVRAKTCLKCRDAHRGEAVPVKVLADSRTENGDSCEITKTTFERVKTLADLVRVCEIDLDVWEVERWVANKWEVGARTGNAKGVKKLEIQPLFQVKAYLKRKSPELKAMESLREGLLSDLRADVRKAPAAFRAKPQNYVKGDYLFEFAPFDLHVGKNTWARETVVNYDIATAESLFNASLDYLLERALRVSGGSLDRILCVFGNDVSHIDNKSQTTTGGTFMDADSRYPRIYRHIVKMHIRAVNILKSVAPVDIVIVSGNHDELTAFHLGELLTARYEGDPSVTVDNNPHLRKYYEYGTNLFGFTHGVSEKISELPLTMAREQPEMWARCESREWHIGHLHKSDKWEAANPTAQAQTLFSDKGVRIRRLTSMSGHDAWHTKHAFMDRRACEAFVFHKTAGFTDHLSFNIDHMSGKPLEAK